MVSSHVINAKHALQKRLVCRSVKPGGCSGLLNVPDRSIFRPSKKNPDTGDRFLLLYHGTLHWHQGLDLAVRAFSKIKDLVPGVDFHIYGHGPSKSDLQSLIEELHLRHRVVLHEQIPLSEMPAVIETAKLGIVPRRN